LKITLLTFENRLVATIRTGNITTLATTLTGIPGIYIDNRYPFTSGFVFQELFKLKETPLQKGECGIPPLPQRWIWTSTNYRLCSL